MTAGRIIKRIKSNIAMSAPSKRENVRILETPPTCDKVERFGVSIDEDTI
jgi:hypothetical protein